MSLQTYVEVETEINVGTAVDALGGGPDRKMRLLTTGMLTECLDCGGVRNLCNFNHQWNLCLLCNIAAKSLAILPKTS